MFNVEMETSSIVTEDMIVSLVEDYVSDQRQEEIPPMIGEYISKNLVDLLTLVEALGVHLTSSDIGRRLKGTQLLTAVISTLCNYQLTRNEIVYLVSFYIDRLKDSSMLTIHVLNGILAIVKSQLLIDEEVVNIVRGLFSQIHNQALTQSSRNVYYSILFVLLRDYDNALSQISPEFILGFIQSVDGEKDPRNLLLVFKMVPLLTARLKLDVLVEDLFEVLSCYFPINFTPSPGEGNSISKDELSVSLRNCLVSSPRFAQYCFPLLLDKLSSDHAAAKIDSLLTLIDGLIVFEVTSLLPFIDHIWNNLKREIFQPVTDEIETASLSLVTKLCNKLTLPVSVISGRSNSLYSFIKNINNDISHYLLEPSLRLINPAGAVVIAIAEGSFEASKIVCEVFLPVLIKQLITNNQDSKRDVVIVIIIKLFKSFKCYSWSEGDSPIAGNYESLLYYIFSSLNGNPSCLVIKAMTSLTELKCLHTKDVQSFINILLTLLNDSSLDDAICNECIYSLGVISSVNSLLIKDMIPTLTTPNNQTSPVIIKILDSISINKDIINLTLPILLSLLTDYYNHDEPSIAILVSKSISNIIESRHGNENYIHENVMPLILKLVIDSTQNNTNNDLLINISDIFYYHNLSLNEELSIKWSGELISIFMSEDDSTFKPLSISSPCNQSKTIIVLTAIIGSAYFQSLHSYCNELLDMLLQFSLNSLNQFTLSTTDRALCYLVNKLEEGAELEEGRGINLSVLLNEIFSKVWNVIQNNDAILNLRFRALTVWQWICKGLLMRSHSLAIDNIKKMMSLFGDPALGIKAATGFELLLKNETKYLTNGKITLFYRQYLFSVCVPELIQLFASSSQLIKQSVLISLTYLIGSVPKPVLTPHLPKLFPLLLESLQMREDLKQEEQDSISVTNILLSSLDSIHSLIQESPEVIGQHLSSIVSLLLHLGQTSPSMKVRITSLKCLGLFPVSSISIHLLYTHQNKVIDGLGSCLDDKKRLVRKEAVSSRSEWYLLGFKDS